jgi:hypothetical protein
MKFSVIIINHNYGEFLRYAIDSALSQQLPPDEVIVVDDGSTDGSAAIILEYGDRIKAVFKPQGGHVSSANEGYSHAKGDICIFLDADDLLYPHCLETIAREWHEGDVKLQYRLDTIDRQGVDQNMPMPHFPPDLGAEEVRRQSFRFGVYPWTVSSGNAFSRALLDQLFPIDAEVIYRSPDGYINKMAPLFGDVKSTSAVLGAYRVHGGNAWAQDGRDIRIEPVLRWLRFDQVLQKAFHDEAVRRGIVVTGADGIRTLQQAEYQLLAHRFADAPRPGHDDGAWELFKAGVRTAVITPNISIAGRTFWFVWLFVMAFMPRSVIRPIFRAARGQMGRMPLSMLLLKLSRGSAR